MWGATGRQAGAGAPAHVSIHAPVWGATDGHELASLGLAVSIHAPVWGATLTLQHLHTNHDRFNPRPRVGGDAVGSLLLLAASSFNPRPRVGGDLPERVLPTSVKRFNPRPRVGGDPELHRRNLQDHVSIHAPVWGATRPGLNLSAGDSVSIHAPVWGATLSTSNNSVARMLFQSTPPCGGRLCPVLVP